MVENREDQTSSTAPVLVEVPQDKPKSWLDPQFERVPRERAQKRQGQSFAIRDVPKIYLEDVEAVVHLIGKYTNDISMQTEEFIIVDPKQLRDVPQEKITEFTIQSRNPHITVDIAERWCRVTTYSDDPEVQELAEDIRIIFLRRVNGWLPKIRKSPLVLLGLLTLIWLALARYLSLTGMSWFLGFYAIGAAGFLYWAVLSKVLSASRGVVVPKYKKETPKSWYVSDQFKVALVTSVLTSIITAFFTAIATVLIVGKQP